MGYQVTTQDKRRCVGYHVTTQDKRGCSGSYSAPRTTHRQISHVACKARHPMLVVTVALWCSKSGCNDCGRSLFDGSVAPPTKTGITGIFRAKARSISTRTQSSGSSIRRLPVFSSRASTQFGPMIASIMVADMLKGQAEAMAEIMKQQSIGRAPGSKVTAAPPTRAGA